MTRRSRRSFWGALSFALIAGAGVSMLFADADKRGIERDAVRQAQLTVQVGIAPLLQGSDLEVPSEGARYEELASGIQSAVVASGPAQKVTLWRQDGRILFSSTASLVGTRQPAMQDLLFTVANGQTTSDVEQGWLQSFVPLWLQPGGTVVVAELDQPYAPIVAQAGKPWRTSALACVALALVSMMGFGLTFRTRTVKVDAPVLVAVSPPSPKRKPKHDARVDEDSPAYMLPGYRAEAEARREAESRAAALEENLRGLQAQHRAALEQLKALDEQVLLEQRSSSQTRDEVELVRDELQQTAQRLHEIEVDRDAVKERLSLRQSELAAAEGRAYEAEARADEAQGELERTLAELDRLQGRSHISKLQEALLELEGGGDVEDGDRQAAPATPRLTLRPEADGTKGVAPATRGVGSKR